MAAFSAAETVTVCAMLQLPTVKVSSVLSSVTSVAACPEMVTLTSPVGWVSSLTAYSLFRPARTLSVVGSIAIPAVSSSVMLTVVSRVGPALTRASGMGPKASFMLSSSSSTSSCTAVKSKVCEVSPELKVTLGCTE